MKMRETDDCTDAHIAHVENGGIFHFAEIVHGAREEKSTAKRSKGLTILPYIGARLAVTYVVWTL